MRWNKETKRFEFDKKLPWVSPEEPVAQFCQNHMPSDWWSSFLWLRDYNRKDDTLSTSKPFTNPEL